MQLALVLPLLLLVSRPLLAAPSNLQPNPQSNLQFDHVDGKTLYFVSSAASAPSTPMPTSSPLPSPSSATPAAVTLKTSLSDLVFVGRIESGGHPAFLFTGSSCPPCADSNERSLYLFEPPAAQPSVFVQPGRIVDPRARITVFDARAFYGQCLSGHEGVYVVFQKERVDRRHSLQSSVFFAEPGEQHLQERLLEKGLPRIQTTLSLVKRKLCHEVSPRNRIMSRKPLDLSIKHPDGDKDEDEDASDSEGAENGSE